MKMRKPMSKSEITAAVVVPIMAILLIIIIILGKSLIGFFSPILQYLYKLFTMSNSSNAPYVATNSYSVMDFLKNNLNLIIMFISTAITVTFIALLLIKRMKMHIALPIIITFGILGLLTTPPFFEMIKYILNGTVENLDRFNIKDIFQKDLINTIPMFIFVVLISVVIYYANTDATALTSTAYKYALFIFIPFLLLMAYNLSTKSPEYAFIGLLALCIIMVIGIYLWMSMNKTSMYMFSFFTKYLLIPLIVLVGFAIFYKMIMEYISNLSGVSGFITELIFFIPCLLIEFLEYIKQQFNITPNSVYILFVIEILLILLYIYLPKIVSNAIKRKSTVLLNKPVFLSKEKLISTSKIGLLETKNSLDQAINTMNYRTNYSISFWTMINTHSNSNISYVNKNNIFKYGHIDSVNNRNYKPYVSYVIDKTGDNYIFQFSNTDDSVYKISLPTQKWHNFVFNYNNSRVDLFINGKLEKTYEFSNNLPVYSSADEIIVGNENGLDGAICNVQYFTVPLTNTDIANLYNLYMMKNPPVE